MTSGSDGGRRSEYGGRAASEERQWSSRIADAAYRIDSGSIATVRGYRTAEHELILPPLLLLLLLLLMPMLLLLHRRQRPRRQHRFMDSRRPRPRDRPAFGRLPSTRTPMHTHVGSLSCRRR